VKQIETTATLLASIRQSCAEACPLVAQHCLPLILQPLPPTLTSARPPTRVWEVVRTVAAPPSIVVKCRGGGSSRGRLWCCSCRVVCLVLFLLCVCMCDLFLFTSCIGEANRDDGYAASQHPPIVCRRVTAHSPQAQHRLPLVL